MKKPLKVLRIILVVVLILIIVASVVIKLFGGRALKIGIESAASKALTVGVSVDDVDLSIIGGKLGLHNLMIDNPEGYEHDKLLELKDARIAVHARSLLSDEVRIKDIQLDGADLVLEQKGLSNNLQDIIKALPKGPERKGGAEPSGKKLLIDNLEISNVTVKVKLLPVPGKADTVTLKLSPIKMTNLGSDKKLDTAALSGKILLALATGVTEQGVGVLPKDLVNTMKSTLDKTLDLGKAVSAPGGKLIDAGKDAGKGLVEGVTGLLTPKKEE